MKRNVIGDRVGILCLAVMVACGLTVTQAGAGGSDAGKGEKQVAMEDLPSPVRAAAEKAITGGALKTIVVEQEKGENAYSVEAIMAGKTKEFTFSSDGTLLAEEEDVSFEQLPEAVRAAAGKYFGGARGLHASAEVAKNVTSYEVEGRKGGERVSAKFSAAGVLLEEEEDED
jgi:hypothetical protein